MTIIHHTTHRGGDHTVVVVSHRLLYVQAGGGGGIRRHRCGIAIFRLGDGKIVVECGRTRTRVSAELHFIHGVVRRFKTPQYCIVSKSLPTYNTTI